MMSFQASVPWVLTTESNVDIKTINEYIPCFSERQSSDGYHPHHHQTYFSPLHCLRELFSMEDNFDIRQQQFVSFLRHTTEKWSYDKLNNIEIPLSSVDRIYFFKNIVTHHGEFFKYWMRSRQESVEDDDNDRSSPPFLYVELIVFPHFSTNPIQPNFRIMYGRIFISKDIETFFKIVLRNVIFDETVFAGKQPNQLKTYNHLCQKLHVMINVMLREDGIPNSILLELLRIIKFEPKNLENYCNEVIIRNDIIPLSPFSKFPNLLLIKLQNLKDENKLLNEYRYNVKLLKRYGLVQTMSSDKYRCSFCFTPGSGLSDYDDDANCCSVCSK